MREKAALPRFHVEVEWTIRGTCFPGQSRILCFIHCENVGNTILRWPKSNQSNEVSLSVTRAVKPIHMCLFDMAQWTKPSLPFHRFQMRITVAVYNMNSLFMCFERQRQKETEWETQRQRDRRWNHQSFKLLLILTHYSVYRISIRRLTFIMSDFKHCLLKFCYLIFYLLSGRHGAYSPLLFPFKWSSW